VRLAERLAVANAFWQVRKQALIFYGHLAGLDYFIYLCRLNTIEHTFMNTKQNLYTLAALVIIFFAANTRAQIPVGYYDTADGKTGEALKTAMHKIVRNHLTLDYYAAPEYFEYTDWHPDGYYWDMYSGNHRYHWSGMNREHSLPKSWWSTTPATTIAYTDLHNLYPSDAEANTAKNNYPLGKVGTVTYTNEVTKVGYNVSGTVYSDLVFEPADQYKGDFARDYFYMVTCYQDYAGNWRSLGTGSGFLNNSTYPVFGNWSLSLLLQWSRNDPVSQKEIDRNDAVFEFQQNRNPFIDFPELAEYIWGNKVGETFVVPNKTEDPALITPTNDIEVNFGSVLLNTDKTITIPVRGKFLSGNIHAMLYANSANVFSLSQTSIPASLANEENGYQLPLLFHPTTAGDYSCNLVIVADGIAGSVSVSVTGKGAT
jgi:endonuclease I